MASGLIFEVIGMKILVGMFLIGSCFASHLDDDANGYLWFTPDKEVIEELAEEKEESTLADSKEEPDWEKILDEKRGRPVRQAFAKAMFTRKYEDAVKARAAYEELFENGEEWADIWKLVELREGHKYKQIITNNMARKIKKRNDNRTIEKTISKISKDYSLVYVFYGNCPLCKSWAQQIKEFAKEYKFSIEGLCLDGELLPEFIDADIDLEVGKQLNPEGSMRPLLLLVKGDGEPIILANNIVTDKELISNLAMYFEEIGYAKIQ